MVSTPGFYHTGTTETVYFTGTGTGRYVHTRYSTVLYRYSSRFGKREKFDRESVGRLLKGIALSRAKNAPRRTPMGFIHELTGVLDKTASTQIELIVTYDNGPKCAFLNPEKRTAAIKIRWGASPLRLIIKAAQSFGLDSEEVGRAHVLYRKKDLSDGKLSDYDLISGSHIVLVLGAPRLGLLWEDVGAAPPADGEEIVNEKLAMALLHQTDLTDKELDALELNQTDLTIEELDALELSVPLSVNSFLRVGARYYRPVEPAWSDHTQRSPMRGKVSGLASASKVSTAGIANVSAPESHVPEDRENSENASSTMSTGYGSGGEGYCGGGMGYGGGGTGGGDVGDGGGGAAEATNERSTGYGGGGTDSRGGGKGSGGVGTGSGGGGKGYGGGDMGSSDSGAGNIGGGAAAGSGKPTVARGAGTVDDVSKQDAWSRQAGSGKLASESSRESRESQAACGKSASAKAAQNPNGHGRSGAGGADLVSANGAHLEGAGSPEGQHCASLEGRNRKGKDRTASEASASRRELDMLEKTSTELLETREALLNYTDSRSAAAASSSLYSRGDAEVAALTSRMAGGRGSGGVGGDGGGVGICGWDDDSGLSSSGDYTYALRRVDLVDLLPSSSLRSATMHQQSRGHRPRNANVSDANAAKPVLPTLFPRVQARPHQLPSQLAASSSAPELKWHNRPKPRRDSPIMMSPTLHPGRRAVHTPQARGGFVLRPRSPEGDDPVAIWNQGVADAARAESSLSHETHAGPPRQDVLTWVHRQGRVGRTTHELAKLARLPPGSAPAAAIQPPAPIRDLLAPGWEPPPPRPPTRGLTEGYIAHLPEMWPHSRASPPPTTAEENCARPIGRNSKRSSPRLAGEPFAPRAPLDSQGSQVFGDDASLPNPWSVFIDMGGAPSPRIPRVVERVGGGWGVGVEPVMLGGAGPLSISPSLLAKKSIWQLAPSSDALSSKLPSRGNLGACLQAPVTRSGSPRTAAFHNNSSWHKHASAHPSSAKPTDGKASGVKSRSHLRRATWSMRSGWSPYYNEALDDGTAVANSWTRLPVYRAHGTKQGPTQSEEAARSIASDMQKNLAQTRLEYEAAAAAALEKIPVRGWTPPGNESRAGAAVDPPSAHESGPNGRPSKKRDVRPLSRELPMA